jgi:hypothetical protein
MAPGEKQQKAPQGFEGDRAGRLCWTRMVYIVASALVSIPEGSSVARSVAERRQEASKGWMIETSASRDVPVLIFDIHYRYLDNIYQISISIDIDIRYQHQLISNINFIPKRGRYHAVDTTLPRELIPHDQLKN